MSLHRQKRISVICNNTMTLNHGMFSERLALHAIAARHGYTNLKVFELLSRDDHFALATRNDASYPGVDASLGRELDREFFDGLGVESERLFGRLDDVTSSDAILFWCGWLHSPGFYECFKRILTKSSMANSDQDAIDILNRHIYLSEEPNEVLYRTISFGQTLVFNSFRQENDRGYGEAYRSFYRRVRKAYMRDVLSAQKIARLRAEYVGSGACVDCAMFLRNEDIEKIPREIPEHELTPYRRKIAVFFGRSDVDVNGILSVVEALSDELQIAAFSLPWGTSYSFPQTKSLPYPAPSIRGRRFVGVGDSLSLIKHASVVVTDTYHVCVNAWSQGVPAVCLGRNFTKSEIDANSGYRFSPIDKRYLLYAMIGALDFYIHEEELQDLSFLKSHLNHVAALIRAETFVREVISGLRKEADAAEDRLVREIDGILIC